ncbi:hypothetical protein [Chamaesiphon sp. GL140_3_metabinner_50]|uniref:DUF7305 domain-containing protein n=1 Tax=Chamaesiphon sp. GL140_3_metabinner_50 TaxID=2970812 RepID=UPI0025E48C29|nr:hypothetical protein [Chamaesiphon sp. GL140_3_metabinner_50]
MSWYLKTFLKYYSTIFNVDRNRNLQAGFSMPLAVGMGLVMMIVVASTIGRSQSDRATTNSQRETNRSLSVAEAGVTRFQAFLDRHQLLATKNLAQWVNIIDFLPSPQAGCRLIDRPLARNRSNLFANKIWVDLDSSDRRKGRYQIINYEYQNGIGKLTIAGEVDNYNSTQTKSKNTLTVNIPIGSEAANIAPPALWTNTANLNPNQKITGQIRSVTCPQLLTIDLDGITGIDASNIALVSGVPSGEIVADPFTPIPPPRTAPVNAIYLPAITSSIILPRPSSSDSPDANNEYHYLVDLDNPSSNHSIKLQDLDRIELNVTPGQKVNLYLKGNIDLAGSKTVNVNAANPNLRIHGSAQTTKLSIKDTATITAFIHAPFADAKSISSSPPNPSKNITGAVWVNSWDSVTSLNELPIIQAGNWADFGITKLEQPSQINPISYWQRIEG